MYTPSMEITTNAMDAAKEMPSAKEISAPFAELIPSLKNAARVRRELGDALIREAEGFEKMIAGYEQAVGIGEPPAADRDAKANIAAAVEKAHARADDGPRGMEAVRRVMREGGDWNAREVHAELEKRGWVSVDAKFPLRATEAAINRLWKMGELEKVRRGRYRYKTAPTDQSSFENGAGGERG